MTAACHRAPTESCSTLSAIEDALEAAARESGLDALGVELGEASARVLH
jgi:hypothetical protein